MTIDEAIRHFEEVAEQKERDSVELIDMLDELDVDTCKECAADHRQLAEWLKELKERRAANVQPIKHGRWICNEELYYNGMTKCSCCNEEYYTEDIQNLQGDLRTVNYCPNCGADMRGDENG